jgi:uncharacterized membrane-anchored protein YhcB (DUF1043 family)
MKYLPIITLWIGVLIGYLYGRYGRQEEFHRQIFERWKEIKKVIDKGK